MGATWTLIDLAGSVALLLWGVHMVQTGLQRAYGPALRRLLARWGQSRIPAFAAGLAVTAVLQSSTATGLMVMAFAADGLLEVPAALATMLGANVGTTLIVQVLSFDVARVAWLFVLLGVVMFRRARATRTRDLGRVAIGLGLMLIALERVLGMITPFEDQPDLRVLLGGLATDPGMGVLAAAVLTWAAHSSVAIVLLIMSLAATNVVPPDAAFAMVLGANLGTSINPILEGAGESAPARRVAYGNMAGRVVGCLAVLAVLDPLGRWIMELEPNPARAVADFHTGFNLVLAVLFLPLIKPWAGLLSRWLPAGPQKQDPGQPIYLQQAGRAAPAVALAAAAREALRMADTLEEMLAGTRTALLTDDRKAIQATRKMDDILDRLNASIKAYLLALDDEALTPEDHRRLAQILTFTTNLEQAGDVIEENLMSHAAKRLKGGFTFSEAGKAEILRVIDRVQANVRAATGVFMTEDLRAARALAAEKAVFREMIGAATAAHLARLREGRLDTAGTSALHLDILSDLKRVNDHLVGGAAYPVLEKAGELLPTRVRAEEAESGANAT